jgi:hypothetical protein
LKCIAHRDDLADDDERRRAKGAGFAGDGRERRDDDLFVRRGARRDDGGRRRRGATVLDQPLREPGEAGEAHERDQRPGRIRERARVELVDVVRGERRHRRGEAAMSDGNVGRRRHGGERRDTGDHLERDAGPRERDRLLPTTPEEVRIAALEPHDAPATTGMHDQKRVHIRLRQSVARNPERMHGRFVEQLRRDEPVVHEHVARAHSR